MALVVALVSIEGLISRAPNTVFELDGKLLKHLEEASAVRPATKEDVAIAKTNGLFIESEDAAAAQKAEADRAAAAQKAEADRAAAQKAEADRAAAEKAEADRAAAEKAKATKATKAADKAAAKADEEL